MPPVAAAGPATAHKPARQASSSRSSVTTPKGISRQSHARCAGGLDELAQRRSSGAHQPVIPLIGKVAHEVVPAMKSAAMLICLDPAAPYGGKLPARADVTYFVTHPAHPSVFNDEKDEEARRDFFGSGKAKQSIVRPRSSTPASPSRSAPMW